MEPESEFTKPLKGYEAREKKPAGRKGLVVAFICLLIAAPVIYSSGLMDSTIVRLFASSEPEEKVEVVVRETIKEEPEEETANLDDETQEAGLVEVTPEENVQPLQPVIPKIIQVEEPKPIRRQEQQLAHLPDPELTERGSSGVIPKKSREGARAMDVYSREPETTGNFGVARVVIVIGGLGISQTSTQAAIEQLPGGVTLAFAPYGNSLNRWMQNARKAGHELLLQVPMEPVDYPTNNPGPHTLKADAVLSENLANLHWSMSRISNYVGVMNYLGGKMLRQPASLTPVFSEIADRGLLFFEDGTVKNSLGEGVAVKALLPYARGNILLDNIRSRAAIAEKLDKLASEAKRTGLAIGVGNAFPDTISLVAQFARQAKELGIEITPVSAVVRDPSK
ncbi:MAG: divergent polysaccharide deacetylase family protein [Pseudomonadota bacterium]